jgi:hypothetical protein
MKVLEGEDLKHTAPSASKSGEVDEPKPTPSFIAAPAQGLLIFFSYSQRSVSPPGASLLFGASPNTNDQLRNEVAQACASETVAVAPERSRLTANYLRVSGLRPVATDLQGRHHPRDHQPPHRRSGGYPQQTFGPHRTSSRA